MASLKPPPFNCPIAVPQHRTVWALPLSLLAHAGLLLALVASVAWKSEPPPTLQAELWEAMPNAALPAKSTPSQAAAPAPKPVAAAKTPVPTPLPEPDAIAPVALKKTIKKPDPKPEPKPEPVKKIIPKIPEPKPAPKPEPIVKPKPEPKPKPLAQPDTSAIDAARRRETDRLNQLSQSATLSSAAIKPAPSATPPAPPTPPTPPAPSAPAAPAAPSAPSGAPNTGTPQAGAAQGGLGAGWGAKLKACVQPNLRFSDASAGNPRVVFVVDLSASGTPSEPVLSRSSGNAAFDAAVSRALLRCDPFPKPETGGYPPSVTVAYRLND